MVMIGRKQECCFPIGPMLTTSSRLIVKCVNKIYSKQNISGFKPKMYEKCKNITVPTTASAQVKNLQVGPKDKLSPTASQHSIGSNMKVLPPSEYVDDI